EMFTPVLESSILGKAKEKDLVEFKLTNFRDFAQNKHQQVDDYPYGGGGGMLLKPEPVFHAVDAILAETSISDRAVRKPRIILMCPQGEQYNQKKAEELANEDQLILICGHYE